MRAPDSALQSSTRILRERTGSPLPSPVFQNSSAREMQDATTRSFSYTQLLTFDKKEIIEGEDSHGRVI
eukprot:g81259.t1